MNCDKALIFYTIPLKKWPLNMFKFYADHFMTLYNYHIFDKRICKIKNDLMESVSCDIQTLCEHAKLEKEVAHIFKMALEIIAAQHDL